MGRAPAGLRHSRFAVWPANRCSVAMAKVWCCVVEWRGRKVKARVEVDGSSLGEPSVSASALSSNGADSSFNQVGERQSVFLGVAVTIQLS